MTGSPPPPPTDDGEILKHGLHHLVQHNSKTSFPPEQYDEGVHLHGSPAPTQDDAYAYPGHQPGFAYQHQHQDSSLGMAYDGLNADYQNSMYQDRFSTETTSSPTPSTATRDMLRTRSGLGIQRGGHQNLRPMPEGRSRVEKSPKPKKARKDKVKPENKIQKLTKPLSELTKEMTSVAVIDIEAYVHRSAEERRKEVDEGKFPGKIKRPMNSFMLYRKAYQNRTKDWCLQNNHQVVSQICGESWPMEPDAIKDKFINLARIERANHQNAHPGYKFSPSKPGAVKGGKRKPSPSEEPMSEESDLDDFEWQAGSRRTKRPRQTREVSNRPVTYPTTKSAYQYSSRETSMEPNAVGYIRSSYQFNNPQRQAPSPYNEGNLGVGVYYQQTVRHHPGMNGVEDISIHKAAVPGAHSYLGLPGGQGYDVMSQYLPFQGQQHLEQRIDPSLIAQDRMLYAESNYGEQMPQQELYIRQSPNGDQHWANPIFEDEQGPLLYHDPDLNREGSQIHDPQMHALGGAQRGWDVDESLGASLDDGSHFENSWMDDEK